MPLNLNSPAIIHNVDINGISISPQTMDHLIDPNPIIIITSLPFSH
jgi:hypothetical protein